MVVVKPGLCLGTISKADAKRYGFGSGTKVKILESDDDKNVTPTQTECVCPSMAEAQPPLLQQRNNLCETPN